MPYLFKLGVDESASCAKIKKRRRELTKAQFLCRFLIFLISKVCIKELRNEGSVLAIFL